LLFTDLSKGTNKFEMFNFNHHLVLCRFNSGDNNRNIFLTYLICVLLISLLLNFPKFLETSAHWVEKMVFNTFCEKEVVVETRVRMSVTWLRMDTTYIHVSSFIR
jgi:hypothetical protein